MKVRVVAAVAVVLLGAAAVTAARLQETPFAPPKPGKEHEFLKQFEGSWDFVSRWTMAPDQPPMEDKGVETVTSACGGLWYIIDSKSEKFAGHGIMGYDPAKKKCVGAWVDNMSPSIWPSEGTVDKDGKVFSSWMEGPDPHSGQMMKMKFVSEIKAKDSRIMTFYMTGPDGKENACGTIEYKRRK